MTLPPIRFLDRRTAPHIATLVLIAGLPALALNAFLPSLPAMAAHFDVPYGVVALTVPITLGANAVIQVFIGPLSDLWGRRPVMIWSFVIFTLASVGIALAPNVETLLALRVVQAAGAAGMVLSRAIVRDMVPQAEAASMIGYVTMGMSVVPMLGPAVGGWIDEVLGWQANFWMFAVLGVGAVWLIWADLGETHPGDPGRGLRAQFREYPELMASPRFWGYVAAAMFSSGAFFAYLGGAPFVGSDVFGLPPSTVGFFFGAPAVGYFLGNFISGRFSTRFGIDRMMLWGSSLTFAGLGVGTAIALTGWHSPWLFFGFMTFVGLGNGMVLPNANAGMLSVRPHLAGTASGLGGAAMIGGGAILSAYASSILGPGRDETPLLVLMTASSGLAVASVLFVIARTRRLARAPAE
ncbi:DHA1 family bicyclomycin/chloramphenicol resistance-like MFS transporter [Hasllibacter halocynthiae]|uniref:Bcr/CflA family efflux transporter n=1 Tax=Hasllibacter halocynthiae TaxID=595589 RepID=A0A2T0X6J1_9RHOB|nr:multidrug effflux MFS transporter [Hasllibacter halocynthiae]PRY94570.1 DHA1 family bicyclomycin/chloramphenicol resistance-like MFS transporter [Hasllibacter halocynthiae]